MKITTACLLVVLGVLTILDAVAQAPQPITRPRQTYANPVGSQQQPDEPELLSVNYRITFSGTSGDKSLGELTTLTCSPRVQVSGPLNSTDLPTSFNVDGTLTEKDGMLIFAYAIGFTVPVQNAAIPPNSGVPQPGSSMNVAYNNHTTTGTLRMVVGEKYEILKCGGNTYTIAIADEAKK
jgi:hypothetical protein